MPLEFIDCSVTEEFFWSLVRDATLAIHETKQEVARQIAADEHEKVILKSNLKWNWLKCCSMLISVWDYYVDLIQTGLYPNGHLRGSREHVNNVRFR
jgi:hypothetical protein